MLLARGMYLMAAVFVAPQLVAVLQGRHAMPPRLRLSWRDPEVEPLLWLPDIVAGAKSLAERGDRRFWSQVDADLLVHRIEAR